MSILVGEGLAAESDAAIRYLKITTVIKKEGRYNPGAYSRVRDNTPPDTIGLILIVVSIIKDSEFRISYLLVLQQRIWRRLRYSL